jgi:hypothetical protein
MDAATISKFTRSTQPYNLLKISSLRLLLWGCLFFRFPAATRQVEILRLIQHNIILIPDRASPK